MHNGDDVMMSLAETCRFYGGPDRPIHYSTLYRGIAAGRYPRPVRVGPNSVRWLRSECRAVRQALVDARDTERAATQSVPRASPMQRLP